MRRERLIEARMAVGKTQEELAELVEVDRTTIGKWERGESTPLPHQRPKYAEALQLTVSELNALLSGVPVGNELPEWVTDYLAHEQSASELRVHEPRAVFGLLQVPDYAAALVGRIGITDPSETYVRASVEQRRFRQKRIVDGDVLLDVIQPEASLRLRVGEPSVMAEQMHKLTEYSELPNVTVRVTPFDAGQYEARRLHVFVIVTHQWGHPRVVLEQYGGGVFLSNPDEVGYFAAAFDQATDLALSPTESTAFIRGLAREWEAKR